MLSVTSAAERLNVSRFTLYRMIHNGAVPAVRLDGTLFIEEDVLDTFIHPHEPRPVRLAGLPEVPRYLSVAEVAGILNTTVDSVRRLVRDGHLKAFRNPGKGKNTHLRIHSTSVQDYVDAAAVESAS